MARISKFASSNPQELASQIGDDKTLRRLYNQRMKSVQRKVGRIERRYGREAVNSNVQELPAKAQGLTRAEMLQGLSQANRYLKSKTSTLTGYRESLRQEKESLSAYGLDVPMRDLPKVNNFLDQLRADGYGSLLPSDQIISAAKRAARRGFTYDQLKGNIEYFASHPGAQYLKADRRSSSDDY